MLSICCNLLKHEIGKRTWPGLFLGDKRAVPIASTLKKSVRLMHRYTSFTQPLMTSNCWMKSGILYSCCASKLEIVSQNTSQRNKLLSLICLHSDLLWIFLLAINNQYFEDMNSADWCKIIYLRTFAPSLSIFAIEDTNFQVNST